MSCYSQEAKKVSYCAVHEILKKVKETGSVRDRERSGRPRFTTPRQDRLLKHLSLNNRRATSRETLVIKCLCIL